ncbi:rod shape-determining protein MreC [Thermus thermamylovorans]|uniref:Cell shape-determining protein MreC n=1 Tax=Thermus thermamylovorans TaxID=2509362 RepID=A0A4Q9B6S5_9DEIN|nr:rod shape-determining protein MreC [Thermus thermamylovorans]TBH21737.1 rod shape-determining protein MreC [Thermus thermamylovorans]
MSERALRRGLFLLLLFLGLALAALTRPLAPGLALNLSPLTAPLPALGHRLGQNLRAGMGALLDRRDLLAENRALRERVALLEGENRRLTLEVERLSRVLEVRQLQAPGVVAVAPVVGEDLSGLYRRLLLGLGERDGLRPGMPVTAPQGLVGLVVEVGERQALVRTLLDPESQVGVRPEGGPGRGVARGAPPDRLVAEFPPTVRVEPGDLLLTGAPLGLFPDGIPVGRVERVERVQGGLKQRAWVRPLVELSLLEEVIVLRPL